MIGKEIHEFAKQLWPLNRSLTGEGVRETLRQIAKHLPNLDIKSVPSGAQVFDWTIPKEWNVRDAYIVTPKGEKICNFKKNNLHLVGYSVPFNSEVTLEELKTHLHTLPEQPNAIPYITSYYEERWGFCLSQEAFNALEEGNYTVVIDTELFDGVLNYGELIIPGKSEKEVFFFFFVCHPSMANNELSGPAVVTFLGKWLEQLPSRKYTYRLIFIPETIGSITYLSLHHEEMKRNIIAGFNVTCVGDNRAYSYLPSRKGSTISDDIAKHVLKWIDPNFVSYSWLNRGGDERQYCAPGIDLPIASILRTMYGEYPEYHTSLDDLEHVVTAEGLNGGFLAIKRALEVIENNRKFRVTVLGEPQMGKRGLYPTLAAKKVSEQVSLTMDFISLCDGGSTLLAIAERLEVPVWDLYDLVEILASHKLTVAVD